jgi:hypothetical protein
MIGILIYHLFFCHLITLLSLVFRSLIVFVLGRNQQNVFEELQAEHLAEKFDSRFELLIEARFFVVQNY